MARRERRARSDRTSGLFDHCRCLFETSRVEQGADGFPACDGIMAGRRVRLALVPDALTLKRLPQLWLSVTIRQPLPVRADFALLARPNGAEFYSTAQRLPLRLDTPADLPAGLLARASDTSAQGILDGLATPLAQVFADPKVKEVAVARRGLRGIVQAREGKRGEHLLLRQCAFGEERIDPATVLAIVDQLIGLEAALLPLPEESCLERIPALG